MDDILTRWASDLATHQKTFQRQAEQVAIWDNALVANSEKIAKLYQKTIFAERDSAEVEKNLAAIEGRQEELGSWLDRYERDVEELEGKLMPEGVVGSVDAEREGLGGRAERLAGRLGEMGRDLSDAVEEINTVSGMLSKSSRADDPVILGISLFPFLFFLLPNLWCKNLY